MRSFEPGDIAEATDFYASIDDATAKAVLDFLIDHPEQRFDGAAVMRQLGLGQHREVAQATSYLGNLAKAVGRRRPWNEGQLGYQMSAAEAALLRQAREHVA